MAVGVGRNGAEKDEKRGAQFFFLNFCVGQKVHKDVSTAVNLWDGWSMGAQTNNPDRVMSILWSIWCFYTKNLQKTHHGCSSDAFNVWLNFNAYHHN